MSIWFSIIGGHGIGLGIIVWKLGAEIILGPLMIKLIWWDRR